MNRVYEFPNGVRYEGEVNRQGLPEGQGTIVYPDGSNYEGEWKNGMKDGRGRQVFTESEEY